MLHDSVERVDVFCFYSFSPRISKTNPLVPSLLSLGANILKFYSFM